METQVPAYSSETAPYTYEAIEGYHIRLVSILQVEPILSLQLEHKKLSFFENGPWPHDYHDSQNQRPGPQWYDPYIAASYTWGDHTHLKTILINGKTHQIGHNCHAALIQLSKQFDPNDPGKQYGVDNRKRFWLDAICINQNDLQEKALQVQAMVEIYRQAQSIASVVGLHADDSEFLFKTIRQFHQQNILVAKTRPRLLFDLLCGNEPYKFSGQASATLSLGSATRAYEALEQFSKRAYWSRIWIVQELAVAWNLDIICGSEMLSIHEIINFVTYLSFSRFDSIFEELDILELSPWRMSLRQSNLKDKELTEAWDAVAVKNLIRPSIRRFPMWIALQVRDAYQERASNRVDKIWSDHMLKLEAWSETDPEAVTYYNLLSKLHSWECTETRDKLYSLLGISWLPEWYPSSHLPKPDYTQSILSTALSAAQVADIVSDDFQTELLPRVRTLCSVFGLSMNHPDIQQALADRRASDHDNHDNGFMRKYDVNCALLIPTTRWRKGCILTGSESQLEDATYVLMIGESDIDPHFVTYHQICVVARDHHAGAKEIVSQAFVHGSVVNDNCRIEKCTLDLEDLIVMICQASRMADLLESKETEDITAAKMELLTNKVCRGTSSWITRWTTSTSLAGHVRDQQDDCSSSE